MTVLNGKYVEITPSYIKETLALSNSAAVLTELKLSEADFDSAKAYSKDIYNTITGSIANIEKVEFSGKKAQLVVIKTQDNEGPAHAVVVDVLGEDGVTSRYVSIGDKVEKVSDEVLEDGFQQAIADGLKHDENFVALSSKLDEMAEKALPFCISGYRHCGPGCGDGLTFGGGTPVNRLDACCQAHDRCWSAFGANNACCDKEICRCALANRGVNEAVADMISTTFIKNAARC
ncbi:hypothetical protein [Bacillus paramycoides]|uniref:hypothetical protein n=1 Tax=Bacillus paramycoides TaxID=2026194 RepID=UPI002E23C392|nr:hypothetical protein [Bacillus paramycoides]